MKRSGLSLKECYAILGIAQGSDLETVKHAYRKRAFELHPDLNPADGASRDFQKLNEAYVVLIRVLGQPGGTTSGPTAAGAAPGNARTGHTVYAEQERQEKARQEAERKERQEKERRERQELERKERERREQEEKKRREAEHRERLRREIDRQEAERQARQEKAREEKARREQAFKAAEQEHERLVREEKHNGGPRPEAYRRMYPSPRASGAKTQSVHTDTGFQEKPSASQPNGSSAAAAYAEHRESPSREELLHELLNDPFARRVYEDIYSEVNSRRNKPAHEESKPRKFPIDWSSKAFQLDLGDGIRQAIKGWMRSQIDEEQELFFPAASLFPGARIRLQIRRGLSGELRTVEITLPQDFVPGKPVRLKGMGKKVGRWQGDLYLTFQIKERGTS